MSLVRTFSVVANGSPLVCVKKRGCISRLCDFVLYQRNENDANSDVKRTEILDEFVYLLEDVCSVEIRLSKLNFSNPIMAP